MSELDELVICNLRDRCDVCNLNDGKPCKLDRAATDLAQLRAALKEAQYLLKSIYDHGHHPIIMYQVAAWLEKYSKV